MTYIDRLKARSGALAIRLEANLSRIALSWLVLAGIGSLVRIGKSTPTGVTPLEIAMRAAPYVIVMLAPALALIAAERWFRDAGAAHAQAGGRSWGSWAIGSWRHADPAELQATACYGVGGVLVSLLVGVLLNVPMRAAEFLVAIPALGAGAPDWFAVLYRWMLIDTVVLTSAYVVVFVAGLRKVAAFPMLLVATWALDLTMQLAIGLSVANAGPIPPEVAAALVVLLTGNIKKVTISVAIWLPYLLLSRRVRATYLRQVSVRVGR